MEKAPETDYAVLVRERNGVYELGIPELLLAVRAADLPKAYEELMARKQRIVAAARDLGMGNELPKAERPALFAAAPQGLRSRILSRFRRLRARRAGGR